jgi:subtilisin family serine protease
MYTSSLASDLIRTSRDLTLIDDVTTPHRGTIQYKATNNAPSFALKSETEGLPVPDVAVFPASLSVTGKVGQLVTETLTVSNSATAGGLLAATISTRETGPSLLAKAAAGVGLPAASRDFSKLPADANFKPRRLLVRFGGKVAAQARAASVEALGGNVMREYSLVPGLMVLELPAGQKIEDALEAYNTTPGVLYAEPDYVWQAIATPDDASFSEMWGLNNTGQTGGTPDADIDAPEAWDVQTGIASPIVAVIDTGVDYNHEDLSANMWTNSAEIPGNGMDDDGNGFVDDFYGYDFVNDDADPMDDDDHGTHVSGTVGASGNNGVGVAGVSWQVRIMALKFLDASGFGTTEGAIMAIEYAIAMGARVMNNSWGGGPFSQALKDAIDAAGAADITFVAAAGNDGEDTDASMHYPSGFNSENIISVMSTDHNDARSGFSNFDLVSVDLGAPGSGILSCKRGEATCYLAARPWLRHTWRGLVRCSWLRTRHSQWNRSGQRC